MPISYPALKPPRGKKFAFGREENTAGTVATGTTLPILQEPIKDVTWASQREEYVAEELMESMADAVADDETTHYDQVTIQTALRTNGLGVVALGTMMGAQTYTPVGASPPVMHTIPLAPLSVRMNTFTLWCQVTGIGGGVATDVIKRWPRGTFQSVHLTWGPNGDVNAEIQAWTEWPAVSPAATWPVTGATLAYVGSDAVFVGTRCMGFRITSTIYGSSGAQYTAKVLSGDITITRPLETNFHSESQNLQDIAPGVLSFSGTLNFTFDGYQAGTIARDFHDFKPGGTLSTPNSLRFSDADGNYIQLVSYPWQLNAFSMDTSGQYAKSNVGFRAYSSLAEANSATPAVSTLKQLVVRNNIPVAQPLTML